MGPGHSRTKGQGHDNRLREHCDVHRSRCGGTPGHLLHAEPDGTFSILGLVWRPGQSTRIHDHITWCIVGVLAGTEHEELFDESLNPVGVRDNPVGEVSGFAPPGDIHRIRNVGDEAAISLLSSVRRHYN